MFTLISVITSFVVGTTAIAQVGGGSAAFNQGGRSGAEEARAHELAKRSVPFGEGRFIDASVLMNAKPDEYIAVFGISQEGETLDQAQAAMEETVGDFLVSIRDLNVATADTFVDF